MNKKYMLLAAFAATAMVVQAQFSGMSGRTTSEKAQVEIPFKIEDPGTKLPDIIWGLDQAWIWDQNLLRGISFAGQDLIGIVRISFQPSHSVESGQLSAEQKEALDERIRIAKMADCKAVNLNSDPQDGKAVNAWYKTSNATTNGGRWALLIALTKRYVEQRGLKVVSVSPFNEPDYANWNQGSKADFLATCKALRENEAYKEEFKDIALCGGNTLNNDEAAGWYNYSKAYLDEGNTHQLAGSFATYASFFEQVKADGKVAVADELHNIMDAMVASNYGLDKAIWWGTAEHVRSQFMKATRGTRLGYGENRDRWVSASVYRHTDGSVQGFVGTSERQARDAKHHFVALDHDVFYNGYGPTRECVISTPGIPDGVRQYDSEGTYCRNTEALVNIQGGDDIMPPLPTTVGSYKIKNRGSGYLLAPHLNKAELGTQMAQQLALASNPKEQSWTLKPQEVKAGGDYFYYTFTNEGAGQFRMGVDRWTINDKSKVYLMSDNQDVHQLWCFSYAGDGYFFIRNRQSGMYLQVAPSPNAATMKTNGRTVNEGVFTGEANQQWRLIPAEVKVDSYAPSAPTEVSVLARPASVRLSWAAPADKDVKSYRLLHSMDGEKWNTIHASIQGTVYVDNTVEPGVTYYYKVQTEDLSLNRSAFSEAVQAAPTDAPSCIMRLSCDSLQDNTWNGNHGIVHGTANTSTIAKEGKSLILRPAANNFIQLSSTIACSEELTFTAWVRMNSDQQWSRIFDFGNGTDQYVFLTPRNGATNRLRLAIKNGGDEQVLEHTVAFPSGWNHVAVTFSKEAVTLYLNGKAVQSSTTMSLRPSDFKPVLNYVGRSQFPNDPTLDAYLDDIRIYNYALTADEVAAVKDFTDEVTRNLTNGDGNEDLTSVLRPFVAPAADKTFYDLQGRPVGNSPRHPGIYIHQGRKLLKR